MRVVVVNGPTYDDVDSVHVTGGYVHVHFSPDPETHVCPKSKMVEHLGYLVSVLP